MLDNFKKLKKINDMKCGEEGYLQVGSLIIDDNGRHWLNLEGKVSSKGGSFLSPVLKRTGEGRSDFEIDTRNAYTPFLVESEKLLNNESYICLDELKDMGIKFFIKKNNLDSITEKLKPLYEIFLDSKVLNQVLINTSIPEIVRGENPLFTGVILYGEGGTGKTSLQKAIGDVYKNFGAISHELHVASMSEKYIGSLGNNLDKKIKAINEESEKLGKPAFIFLDEATSLVMSKDSHNTSGADYYQEAVDVLKKYISNYPNLVFSITTNAAPDIYDDTLIREGRLAPIEIPLPGKKEKMKMWQFFIAKYDIPGSFRKSDYEKLAELTKTEKGSFISEFAKGYLPGKKLELETMLSKSDSILDALATGCFINMDSVKDSLKIQDIFDDVEKYLLMKNKRKEQKVLSGFLV